MKPRIISWFLSRSIVVCIASASVVDGISSAQAQPNWDAYVLSDQQLLEASRDSFDRGDYIEAAIQIHALVQRMPDVLKGNAAELQRVQEARDYALARLLDHVRDAERLLEVQRQLDNCRKARVSGVKQPPPPAPEVDWNSLIRGTTSSRRAPPSR